MRIAFRTDASHAQGMGDVAMSLAVANELRRLGDEVTFVVSGEPIAAAAVRAADYPCTLVSSAGEEAAAIVGARPDVVVVNMLNRPPEHIRALKQTAPVVVVVDDAGPGAAAADVAVNILYRGARGVLGFDHLPLKHSFADAHGVPRTIAPRADEILVTQGGADTPGFTPKIVRALNCLDSAPHCTVVVGPAFRHHAELADALRGHRLPVQVVENVTDMAPLMLAADLAISAGGITLLELACVGTPSIAICGDWFEEETAARVAEAGATLNLGFGGPLSEAFIASSVQGLIVDAARRAELSAAGRRLTDGRGAARVAALVRSARPAVISR